MSRRWALSLLCLSLLFLSLGQLTHADSELRVNETATKVLFQKERAEVVLAVQNSTGKTVNARVEVELLTPNDKSKVKVSQVKTITTGKTNLTLPLGLSFSKLKFAERQQLFWYRLRYRLLGAESNNTLAEGFISLSEITPDLFDLYLITSGYAREGHRYRARVQAIHPITRRPAANVTLEGELQLSDDEDEQYVTSRSSKITDAHGHAALEFELPRRFPQDPHNSRPTGAELTVTGKRGGVVAEVSGDVPVDQFSKILISTDKPLYQPGQVMHVRALAFSPDKRALQNQAVLIRISDPETTDVYRTVVKSSRFGVASADWSIPDNVRLGQYQVTVEVDEDSQASYVVRVSRYDLPNFTASVETDRKYYLPGQNAEVKVRADYLFGQPVKSGQVRVVEETSREWNYREQKWDIDEGEKFEGTTDKDGFFIARVDLSKYHKELKDQDYSEFEDITYAAYFTDLTTNRTEQRRFDLRVTKEAIHIYVLRSDNSYDINPNLPLEFYVSTSYADGTPARCEVRAKVLEVGDDNPKVFSSLPAVRTNRYGLTKISGTRLPGGLNENDDVQLVLSGTDSQRRTGFQKLRLYLGDQSTLRVEADKALYRAGEPIKAVITSTLENETVNVDLIGSAAVLRSERVKLRDGRAAISFPYKSDFKDRLTIAVYADLPSASSTVALDTVLYPRDSELKVNMRMSQKSYRPGEDANADLNVRAPTGSSAESALGVVVFDKAVEERFRTDQEFGSREASSFYHSLQSFLGFDEQLAGVTLGDLQRLDMSKTVSPDLELVADLLLSLSRRYVPALHGGYEYRQDLATHFRERMQQEAAPITRALKNRYLINKEHPNNPESLRRFLRESQVDLDSIHDPWGVPYKPVFRIDRDEDVFDLTSSGPDKRFGTADDLLANRLTWRYFRPEGQKIDKAVQRHHERTGGFIFDFETLREESLKEGLNLDQLLDRWGKPYRATFTVQESKYVMEIVSAGPDGKFVVPPYVGDDFVAWTSTIDYFAEKRAQLQRVLTEYLENTKRFPQNNQELHKALPGEDLGALRDPWGRTYYWTFRIQHDYADHVRIENKAIAGGPASERVEITPVIRAVALVNLRSAGPDGLSGTIDDFSVATFAGILSEQKRDQAQPRQIAAGVAVSVTNGTVYGMVTDFSGAVVANASVVLKLPVENVEFVTETSDAGKYVFGNLKRGLYQLRVEARGFKASIVESIWVSNRSLIEINVTLDPGAITETVTITGGAVVVNQTTALTISSRQIKVITKPGVAMETPRLRAYFPETLLWQPSIETDRKGRAKINFKLADNITTWKMAVVASTADGLIATTEKEIRAFQPFFVEHDPPRILTEGDEISLPVVVRNYLEREQKVDLEIKPESWFSLLGPAQKRTAVVAGDAKRETFDFRVVSSTNDGKQRITAIGADANDAIEKPVNVHPDGEEISLTDGAIVGSSGTLEVELPENSIPRSSRAELKIYPNLMGHVIESVEAIMSRPYGCAEQTISSTYPSLLLLRHQKQSGEEVALSNRARLYLTNGYSRLLNYRTQDGSFGYWGHSSDLAVTAYALRFLTEASDLIEVDPKVINDARAGLIKEQQADGRWRARAYWREEESLPDTVMLTAYVTRVLAMTGAKLGVDQTSSELSAAQKLALDYLSRQAGKIDEPYMLASLALAMIDAQDFERAAPLVEKLRSLAHTERNMNYWSLETNTPFYGWGRAGRVETTALVVQVLNRYCRLNGVKCAPEDKLVERGLLFLLKQKDRYGVWHSTQATINVLDALLTMLLASGGSTDSPADIVVNGRAVSTIQMPGGNRLVGPITVDLTQFVRGGKNAIEIKRPSGSAYASAQALLNFYLPWPKAITANHFQDEVSNDLRLTASFDKTEAGINDTITVHVEAKRVAFRGYGMMLAEIGLPPGADVDRNSLEMAMKASGGSINQYDVLPDRVVIYLWPRAGGVKFDFKFRPRFGLNAKAAPSVLYDYYNPEARVTLAPQKFRVK